MLRSWILINGNSVLFGNKNASYIVCTYKSYFSQFVHTSYKYIMLLKSIMNNIDIIFMKHTHNVCWLYHCCSIPNHPIPCNASSMKWWSEGLTVESQIPYCVRFENRKKEGQREGAYNVMKINLEYYCHVMIYVFLLSFQFHFFFFYIFTNNFPSTKQIKSISFIGLRLNSTLTWWSCSLAWHQIPNTNIKNQYSDGLGNWDPSPKSC